MRPNLSLCKCLPFALAVMALVVTGCPHNDYTIQLKPHGNVIERMLTFYCSDGENTNGAPNYSGFNAQELAAITAFYPTNGLTNYGDGRYVVRGEFTNVMPGDVGGAGLLHEPGEFAGRGGLLCGAVPWER